MSRRTIVVLPGDGIGPVVIAEALRVLDAVGLDADFVEAEIGWSCWRRDGAALPARTVALLAAHKVGLLGAITSKGKDDAERELPEALRETGHAYYSPILDLRQRFRQEICVRPAWTFPGNPRNFIRRRANGTVEQPSIRAVVFRQNTEGTYAGVEWTDPPAAVREALRAHPRFRMFDDVLGPDLAIGLRVVTRGAARRIARAAFEHARREGLRTVTVCEKPNVLRETSGLMEETACEVASDYPEVALESINIDAIMMELGRRPEKFEVIVASNLFGDILSDAFCGLTGGLGFAASANLSPEIAVFEPVHGSAPKYAGIEPAFVNPCAAILASAMLLDHMGETERAATVRSAVASVVAAGRVRTYDMLGLPGGPDVLRRGAAATREMTDAIIREMK